VWAAHCKKRFEEDAVLAHLRSSSVWPAFGTTGVTALWLGLNVCLNLW
jgi:hypothetical protein